MEYDLTDGTQRRHKIIAIKSTQIFLFSGVILLSIAITVLCIGFLVRYEVETDVLDVDRISFWLEKLPEAQKFWYDDGIQELRAALKVDWCSRHARNVIIFVAHGVGATAQAAVRFGHENGNVQQLKWENFEHFGRILQPCNASSNCNTHTLATAFYSGVRTKNGIGGLDATVEAQNCTQAMNEFHQIKSILRQAQERHLRTGFITTNRVSGPTIAALYAHTPDVSWECDADIPPSKILQGCKDIATQLIDDETGEHINVIMGGGRQALVSNPPITNWDPLDSTACISKDTRNYLRDWRTLKRMKKQRFSTLQNSEELRKLNGSQVDYVFGVFANGNIKPTWTINSKENQMPKLSNMVVKALEVLRRNEAGFLLVVESGKSGLDISNQVKELKRLNETINEATKLLSADTLMIVVLNGGQNLHNSTTDGFETNVDEVLEDINIFSNGPSSHLLHGIYEETYLAHVVSYALKMGQFQDTSSKN